MNELLIYPSLITPNIIQREFLRLMGEVDMGLVSVKVRKEADHLAADVEVKGKCFQINFEEKALAGSLDDFTDYYIAPAIEMLDLK